MNAIAAHKHQLEKLLEDLSTERVPLGITFVACVNAYIARLDTNCSDISARVTSPPARIDGELTYGTHIDSKLRALLRATQSFTSARQAFPKISRCGPQTSAGCLPAAAARRIFQAFGALPGQWTLIDVQRQVNRDDGVKEIKSESRTSGGETRAAPGNIRGKPKYLFRGMVK